MKRLSALERAKLPQNDLGNARRLFEAARGLLLWIEDAEGGKGAWAAFDDVAWSSKQSKARSVAFAHAAARGISDERRALREADPQQLSEVFGPKFTRDMADSLEASLYLWGVKSGDSARTRAMLEQFKGLRDDEGNGAFLTQAAVEDFDADPFAYHTSNGVLRFGQGQDGVWRHSFSAGHDPADMFMQTAGVAYDRSREAPHWLSRINVMQRDEVTRSAIKRIYGMTLTGLISDQAFYIFQGKGQDGKSVTNDVICDIHGMYARNSSPKTFLEGPVQAGAAHQSDIVRLAGDVRLVVTDEPKKNSTFDGERIKQATGSKMVARGAHATTELSFTPHWQLIMECNTMPKPPSDDRGFRRRFKIYPFTVQFGVTPGVPDEPVDVIKKRLAGEHPGILNWMIEGALEWLNERVIPEPDMSRRALASFWATNSRLGEWMEACCDMSDPDARTGATALYQAFRQFCIDNGDKEDKVMHQTSFGLRMNDAQIYAEANHQTGKKDRVGIRLRGAHEGRGALDIGEDDPFA